MLQGKVLVSEKADPQCIGTLEKAGLEVLYIT